MTDTDITDQGLHMATVKDIAHQAIAFAQKKLTLVFGDDTRSILTAML